MFLCIYGDIYLWLWGHMFMDICTSSDVLFNTLLHYTFDVLNISLFSRAHISLCIIVMSLRCNNVSASRIPYLVILHHDERNYILRQICYRDIFYCQH